MEKEHRWVIVKEQSSLIYAPAFEKKIPWQTLPLPLPPAHPRILFEYICLLFIKSLGK